MREECVLWNFLWGASGITPACAGRIGFDFVIVPQIEDHPRMCGKNPAQKYMCFREEGSPPHVREELACLSLAAAQLGITPACAGRIRGAFLLLPFFKDHPRMCGKNRFRTGDVTDVWGSPPRMREESGNSIFGEITFGITPAHAGRMLSLRHKP